MTDHHSATLYRRRAADALVHGDAPLRAPGPMAMAWRRFRRDRLALIAAGVLLFLAMTSLAAPLLARHVTGLTPEQIELGATLKAPGFQRTATSARHYLGTDELGRDVLTRVIYGGRVSLYVALLTVLISLTIGTLVGAASGYYGGVIDALLMRLVDVVLAVPALFLLILIAVVFRPNVTGLALVLAALGWTGVARLVRGEFLTLKRREFVDAARVVGVKDRRIILRHILPNASSPIIVAASLSVGNVILTETALSFLGMGVQLPQPSWGNMLSNAQQYLYRAPFLIVIPGFFILVTVLAANLLGNGLRDALDPKAGD